MKSPEILGAGHTQSMINFLKLCYEQPRNEIYSPREVDFILVLKMYVVVILGRFV